MRTLKSLFGNQLGKMIEGVRVVACRECGTLVAFSNRHVAWHNKMEGSNAKTH